MGCFTDISSDKSTILKDSLPAQLLRHKNTERHLNIWLLVYSKSLPELQSSQTSPPVSSRCSQLCA